MAKQVDNAVPPAEGEHAEARASASDMEDPKARRAGDLTHTGGEAPVREQERDAPLLGDVQRLRAQWEAVQAGFVDEPRRAVEQADALVDAVIQELVDTFSSERRRLEDQWSGGEEVSTEDLRVALQRYRSFFNRLTRT